MIFLKTQEGKNMNEIINTAIQYFSSLGYIGMFCGMFLSNSFIPFPSEIVMIPAGIFVATGKFGFIGSVLAGTLGGICGSLFNYILALKLGREILIKWKIVKIAHMNKSDEFFEKFGVLSVLFGSVMPVIRQYISVPAGLSKMNVYKFIVCVGMGVCVWVTFLTSLGFFVGDNLYLRFQILSHFNIILILLVVVTIAVIVLTRLKKWHKCRTATKKEIKTMIETEVREEIKDLIEAEVREEIKDLIEAEVKEEVEDEVEALVKKEVEALDKKKSKKSK